jgi:hypothetical protein
MVANEELRLVAEGLLTAHGDKAFDECRAVIAKMTERGDREGAANWTAILAVVSQLQSMNPE